MNRLFAPRLVGNPCCVPLHLEEAPDLESFSTRLQDVIMVDRQILTA
jgi:hypothetical protein